jgi:hypothetical protein
MLRFPHLLSDSCWRQPLSWTCAKANMRKPALAIILTERGPRSMRGNWDQSQTLSLTAREVIERNHELTKLRLEVLPARLATRPNDPAPLVPDDDRE